MEQKEWNLEMERYSEAKAKVIKNLSSCYFNIWDHMTRTLQNGIKVQQDLPTKYRDKAFKVETAIGEGVGLNQMEKYIIISAVTCIAKCTSYEYSAQE